MLRHNKYIEPYPSRTVTEDVLTRLGEPDNYSFTPFNGLEQLVRDQFKGSLRDRFNMSEFLEYVQDNDLDPKKINKAEMLYGLELQEKQNAGYTRLEELIEDQAPVEKYMRDLLIGYKKNSNSPFNKNAAQLTYTFKDEEGREVEEKFLQKKDSVYDLESYYKVIEEIPYLLKQIHQRSKQIHAHLFSFLRAYILIRRSHPTGEIQPQEFSHYELYRIKSDGSFDRMFDHAKDNRGEDYPYARRFICGEYVHDNAYKACMKLATDLDIIGVDIAYEDPKQYNNSFINRLVCTYIPKNEEYYATYGNIDPEVVKALHPDRLFQIMNSTSISVATSYQATRDDVIACIKSSLDTQIIINPGMNDNWSDKSDELFDYVKEYVELMTGGAQVADKSLFTIQNDFVHYKGKLSAIPGNYVNRYSGEYPTIIFHRSGLIIVLPESYDGVHYVTLEDAKDRLRRVKAGVMYENGWQVL